MDLFWVRERIYNNGKTDTFGPWKLAWFREDCVDGTDGGEFIAIDDTEPMDHIYPFDDLIFVEADILDPSGNKYGSI